MWWFLIGVGVGVLAGRETVRFVELAPGAVAAGRPGNEIYRVSDDLINASDTMRPFLLRIRAAARDGRITLDEWIGLYAEVGRL